MTIVDLELLIATTEAIPPAGFRDESLTFKPGTTSGCPKAGTGSTAGAQLMFNE